MPAEATTVLELKTWQALGALRQADGEWEKEYGRSVNGNSSARWCFLLSLERKACHLILFKGLRGEGATEVSC